MDRAYALSIAGFDPSSGAGVVADVKTFESFECTGLSVVTALTYQTEDKFLGLKWISEEEIKAQLDPLLKNYPIAAIKIGLIESLERLSSLVSHIKSISPETKIIWDPIIKASSGFEFHKELSRKKLDPLLSKLDLITPNREEALFLLGKDETYKELGKLVPTLIKSFSLTETHIVDRLTDGDKIIEFKFNNLHQEKHGSGCVLSSAICAALATGLNLVDSITVAKDYIASFLGSSETLLGIHQNAK